MKKKWKVAIVEPCHLVCAGIVSTFARTAFTRYIHCATMEELWRTVHDGDDIDLFIIDVEQSLLPIRAELDKLRHLFPNSFIVLLADTVDHGEVTRALEANVNGFIPKTTRPEALIKSLELVVLGEGAFPARVLLNGSGSPLEAPVPTHDNGHNNDMQGKSCGLSTREIEVLRSLGEGKSNKEIARQLDISDETVKVHVKAILRKLRVENRTKAALWVTGASFADPLSPELKVSNSPVHSRVRITSH